MINTKEKKNLTQCKQGKRYGFHVPSREAETTFLKTQ